LDVTTTLAGKSSKVTKLGNALTGRTTTKMGTSIAMTQVVKVALNVKATMTPGMSTPATTTPATTTPATTTPATMTPGMTS